MWGVMMIDYEKLKYASEMCIKTPYYFDIALGVDDGLIALFDSDSNVSFIENYTDLDELISKIEELKKPQQIYQIFQKVWKLNVKHEPCSYIITDVDKDLGYYLNDMSDWYTEKEIYPTKQSLIEAQIEYWQQMKADIQINQHQVDVDRCQHE
jgi:hypothetical protein